MLTHNKAVSFTAIQAKGYAHPRDKKPVEINIKDGKMATISGRPGVVMKNMYITEDGKAPIGPFARITVDKVDKKSELWLKDKADVPIKLIDTDGRLELYDESIARVKCAKKAGIMALNDSLLIIKSAMSGCEASVAHKAEAVIDKVNFVVKDVFSKIKVESSAFFRVKKVENAEVRNFIDGGTAIMSVEPPQPVKKK